VAAERPKQNLRSPLGVNFELEKVYLPGNCASQICAERQRPTFRQGIFSLIVEAAPIVVGAFESECHGARFAANDLAIAIERKIKGEPRSLCLGGWLETGSKAVLQIAHCLGGLRRLRLDGHRP
jgi:hypothetical protein